MWLLTQERAQVELVSGEISNPPPLKASGCSGRAEGPETQGTMSLLPSLRSCVTSDKSLSLSDPLRLRPLICTQGKEIKPES